jgi:hypothetical protein
MSLHYSNHITSKIEKAYITWILDMAGHLYFIYCTPEIEKAYITWTLDMAEHLYFIYCTPAKHFYFQLQRVENFTYT